MRNTTTRRLTAVGLAIGIAGAGIVGTAAAPEAAAKVDAGHYTFHDRGFLAPPSTYPVQITKTRWINRSAWGGSFALRQTRNGAVVTNVGQPTPFPATYILSKRPGGRYHVVIHQFGIQTGTGTLIPRR